MREIMTKDVYVDSFYGTMRVTRENLVEHHGDLLEKPDFSITIDDDTFRFLSAYVRPEPGPECVCGNADIIISNNISVDSLKMIFNDMEAVVAPASREYVIHQLYHGTSENIICGTLKMIMHSNEKKNIVVYSPIVMNRDLSFKYRPLFQVDHHAFNIITKEGNNNAIEKILEHKYLKRYIGIDLIRRYQKIVRCWYAAQIMMLKDDRVIIDNDEIKFKIDHDIIMEWRYGHWKNFDMNSKIFVAGYWRSLVK